MNDLISWAAAQARQVDCDLEQLADRALALGELQRAALVVAGDSGSLGCTLEALIAAHRGDPAATAGIRSLLRRAVGPEVHDTIHDRGAESPGEDNEHDYSNV